MATLNLSTNGPSIAKSYQTVIDSSLPGSGSPTYGQWAIFSVSAPLINAFQQDSGSKESVLKVQDTGAGELLELIEEFSEGKIQFAFVKVLDPNSRLPKNVLIAWCGEGVPERTKGYFTSHLAAVSKFLHGYHVQITARSEQDLTAEGIVQKVGDASGAKYSTAGSKSLPTSTHKPPVSTKPVFTPTRTGGSVANSPAAVSQPTAATRAEDDGWGPDAPPVTRTSLEKVQPAYKPTKVNIEELKAGLMSTPSLSGGRDSEDRGEVIKGGYKPVGKVDIAAIRRQAREAGNLADDRPEPVKGAYQPVGKIDIAAIRAKAQGGNQNPVDAQGPVKSNPASDITRYSNTSNISSVANQYERLTSLPKPKVAKNTAPNATFGTKPPLPSQTSQPIAPLVGSASRTFADEGGKTPAQLWSERKAKERGPLSNTIPSNLPDIKSSTPPHNGVELPQGNVRHHVQAAQTGDIPQTTDHPLIAHSSAHDSDTESAQPSTNLGLDDISYDKPSSSQDVKEKSPSTSGVIPVPGLQEADSVTKFEDSHEYRTFESLPTPPEQPRSPTPPTPLAPARELSPIRVAAPIGKGLTDVHSEQQSPPPALPTESLQEALPKEEDLDDDQHDIGRATAEATVSEDAQHKAVQAVVLYDYEKAEDNEIELREGGLVNNIEMVDKDWWLGSNAQGDRGLFPSNYVELVSSSSQTHNVADTQGLPEDEEVSSLPNVVSGPPTTEPEPASEPNAIALYDYEAAEDNELSFPEGAEISHIEFPDDDWWFGHYNGKTGLFPANYVQLGN
ncbi:putative actin binding protein [Aspergillus saccharolyticus JOP 1030-1]|uniref:Actin binding protein n=1 Tax=Aspergillus saccharolyticus JOP 1030-1 TaxID=1450539 RepID=A0A318ZLW1_9EURO|nr:hypothetical protein BP01DRAFT_297916 [Aspergillus saccharolyticus JOP 1030-1]PYH44800.1 hypothetical protein BP01DRAFT_297916 [Aspergillus saccharolyticus JOP 1030-1]